MSLVLNNKFRSFQEDRKRGRWRKHLSMGRCDKHARLQATASRCSPRLIHCISQSCTRPLRGRHLESRQNRSLLPVRMKGRYAVQLFFWWEWNDACMSAHGFFAAVLGSWTGAWRARSTPVTACDVCFKWSTHGTVFAQEMCVTQCV